MRPTEVTSRRLRRLAIKHAPFPVAPADDRAPGGFTDYAAGARSGAWRRDGRRRAAGVRLTGAAAALPPGLQLTWRAERRVDPASGWNRRAGPPPGS
ncbi:MAG TPA: hypothetical protein VKB03_00560 [Conexibacter sp.]|nr:hypothetical protein [Conexibacter sp.]